VYVCTRHKVSGDFGREGEAMSPRESQEANVDNYEQELEKNYGLSIVSY